MIADCAECGAQNFVSRERLAARHVPPACWKCGGVLDVAAGMPADAGKPGETAAPSGESKVRAENRNLPGSG